MRVALERQAREIFQSLKRTVWRHLSAQHETPQNLGDLNVQKVRSVKRFVGV